MKFLSAHACLISLAICLTTASAHGQEVSTPATGPTLTLSAFGETAIKPDMATLDLGVDSTELTAAAAMTANARRMTDVIAVLKKAGLGSNDLQTSGLSLSPQYAYDQNRPPRLTGYQVTNRLTVTVHDLTRLGPIADAVTNAGASSIGGISFALANPQAAEDLARVAAVKALQDKATLYTRATGYRGARLLHLSEGAELSPGPRPQGPMMAMRAQSVVSTPVETGEVKVRIDINGTFALER